MKYLIIILFLLSHINSNLAAKTIIKKNYAITTARNWLNMRKSTSINSDIIKRVPYYSRVKVLQTKSEIETIAGKNGQWEKIEWGNTKGWVFGAYLKKINYSDPVIQYMNYLEKLNKKNLNSIIIAKKKFREIFLNNKKQSAHGFRLFRIFHNLVILNFYQEVYNNKKLKNEILPFLKFLDTLKPNKDNNFINKINPDRVSYKQKKYLKKNYNIDLEKIPDYKNLLKKLKLMKKCGIKVIWAEDQFEFEEDFKFFIHSVLKGFNTPLKSYFLFRKKYDVQVCNDAGFLISWEEFRRLIIAFENFIKKYAFLFEAQTEAFFCLESYLHGYIHGIENTPISLDGENIDRKLLASYENYIKYNRNSKFYPVIKNIFTRYKKNNFKIIPDLYKYTQTINYHKLLFKK